MTSTAVKEVGSFFANAAVAQAGKNARGAADFQNIWNDQINKNTAGNSFSGSAAETAKKQNVSSDQLQRGSSLKAKDSQVVKEDPVQETAELSPEEQEQAMQVLGSAAIKLMQEIADAFGITVEELQTAMEDLSMGPMDVLEASKLSGLLLKLGGAEDLYALVTDGELYENYQMLMNQLSSVLQESADELGIEPEQLLSLLQEKLESNVPAEEGLVQVKQPGEDGALWTQDSQSTDVQPAVDTNEAQKVVQEVQNQGQQQDAPKQERHSEGKADREPQFNLLLQNLRAEQFQPEAAQTQGVAQSSPWSESTQNIMNQILDYMKLQLNADSTNLEMQLHPASLGTLQIQLASKAGVVTANFIAQNEAVKAALETQMVQLKEQFEEQGIRVESIEVTVQTHEFERNLDEQGRGRNGQPEKKNRTRRIQLDSAVSTEDVGEEPVADRVAVTGSTVEYTA